MNNRELEIENTLRSAPQPAAPTGLKNKLVSQVKLPTGHASSQPVIGSFTFGGWLRRWWPALVPAAVSVACAVAISVQQQEIKELKQSIQTLTEKSADGKVPASPVPVQSASVPNDTAARHQQEIEQLKQQAAQLKAEVAQLEKFRTENPQLRSQLAKAGLPPELQEFGTAMQEARDKAQRIACVNNMKQIGLAVRIWSNDHGDTNPPNFFVLSKELNTPKILVCPADFTKQAAADWTSFTLANCSYEYMGGRSSGLEPNCVLARCPIHGTVGLCDGSVHQLSPERAAQVLINRDGKLYLEQPPAHATGALNLQDVQTHDAQVYQATTEQTIVNACINHLRQLDGAMQQWALENKKTAQAIPTAQDIAPYLKNWPVCPAGGRYVLNAVGAVPTCTIPGHGLPRSR